jgi:hypothetical protein
MQNVGHIRFVTLIINVFIYCVYVRNTTQSCRIIIDDRKLKKSKIRLILTARHSYQLS